MSMPDPIRPALQCVVYNAPFLAHLIMALSWRMDDSIETACTNGIEVRVNPQFFEALSTHERAGLLAHESLHCALRHSDRAKRLVQSEADAVRWNVAADIVCNGACERAGMTLPKGAIRDRKIEHLSVEEIYRTLKKGSRGSKTGKTLGAKLRDLDIDGAPSPGGLGADGKEAIDWPATIRRADILARRHGGLGVGSSSLQIDRELAVALGGAQIDWRMVLARYLTEAPSDWGGWDRRHIHRGNYFPTLVGRKLRAVVGIDVSGSIGDKILDKFLTELGGILQSAENLEIDLYWTDTRIHGPERLTHRSNLNELKSKGGGGTDLGPLFTEAEAIANREGLNNLPTIYLTDGYGPTLDREPSSVSALWVIPNNCALSQPWGQIVPIEAPK
jgi:predicted metal-dependent peptidase